LRLEIFTRFPEKDLSQIHSFAERFSSRFVDAGLSMLHQGSVCWMADFVAEKGIG
jgi:hypothetical protein